MVVFSRTPVYLVVAVAAAVVVVAVVVGAEGSREGVMWTVDGCTVCGVKETRENTNIVVIACPYHLLLKQWMSGWKRFPLFLD